MAEVVRAIDTPRGSLLVTVQRVADRYATRELTADDLRQAARTLFREAALMSKIRIVSVPMSEAAAAAVEEVKAIPSSC